MRLNHHVDERLERWAAWKTGSKGMSIAPWARLRYGTAAEQPDPPPRDEERETDRLVQFLAIGEQQFLQRMYPYHPRNVGQIAGLVNCSASAVAATLCRLHVEIQRMIDQRRAGEDVDPKRRPLRSKSVRFFEQLASGKRRAVASVLP